MGKETLELISRTLTNARSDILDISEHKIEVLEAHCIATALRSGRFRQLHLGKCGLRDGEFYVIAEAFAEAPLESVQLYGNRLSARSIAVLAERLPGKSRLEVIDVRGNPICDSAGVSLGRIIRDAERIDVLRVDGTQIGDRSAGIMALAIPGSGLRTLSIRHTRVTGQGLELLSNSMAECSEMRLLTQGGAAFSNRSNMGGRFRGRLGAETMR